MDLTQGSDNYQLVLMVLIKHFGQLGNDLFIVASAWFLLDKDRINGKRVIGIVLDSFLISVIILAVISRFFSLNTNDIIKHLFPILFNNLWFVGAYLILYVIHPGLNIVIKSLSQKNLPRVDLVLFLLYCIVNTVFHDRYYYTPLVGFIVIYFFVGYTKNYMNDFINNRNRALRVLIISFILLLASVLFQNVVSLYIPILRGYARYWSIIINPILIAIAIPLICLLASKERKNKAINYLSSLTLFTYLIHANPLIMDKVKMAWYEYVFNKYGYGHVLVWVILTGAVIVVCSFVLSVGYSSSIHKIVMLLIDKLWSKILLIDKNTIEYLKTRLK